MKKKNLILVYLLVKVYFFYKPKKFVSRPR